MIPVHSEEIQKLRNIAEKKKPHHRSNKRKRSLGTDKRYHRVNKVAQFFLGLVIIFLKFGREMKVLFLTFFKKKKKS
jgi:hypothetical protein